MTTRSAAAYTGFEDGLAAGQHLAAQIVKKLEGAQPDAVIVFASSRFDHAALLAALQDGCRPKVLVGASSAGEFANGQRGEGTACALAIHAPAMRFNVGLGTGLSDNRKAAADQLVGSFRGVHTHDYQYRAAIIMSDGLAGHFDDLVEQLTVATAGTYQFVGAKRVRNLRAWEHVC